MKGATAGWGLHNIHWREGRSSRQRLDEDGRDTGDYM